MRPLARVGSAVFLLYLPTVYLFLSRLFALTKQLRPALYLPVAAFTSGGRLQPFAVPADIYTLRASGFPTHSLLSLSGAQSLHLHGWATVQRVFGQTSRYSVLASSTCFAAARLFLLRSFPARPLCRRCACRRRIGIDDRHLC